MSVPVLDWLLTVQGKLRLEKKRETHNYNNKFYSITFIICFNFNPRGVLSLLGTLSENRIKSKQVFEHSFTQETHNLFCKSLRQESAVDRPFDESNQLTNYRLKSNAQALSRGPLYPISRANPFPEVTDLFCRLPLPTLFYWLEVINLGDLLRLWVRPDEKTSVFNPFKFQGPSKTRVDTPRLRVLFQSSNLISGWSDSEVITLYRVLRLLTRKENSSQGLRQRIEVQFRYRFFFNIIIILLERKIYIYIIIIMFICQEKEFI